MRRGLGCQTRSVLAASREAALLQAKTSGGLACRDFKELPGSSLKWSLAPDSPQVTQGLAKEPKSWHC